MDMTPSPCSAWLLSDQDDVAVARAALNPGDRLPLGGGVLVVQAIGAGHKVAVRAVAAGQPVRKYGQVIGVATQDIAPGQHVHSHNLGMADHATATAVGASYQPLPRVAVPAQFEGYVRSNGRVGTRNHVAIVSTVNCSASVARALAQAFSGDALAAYPGVDGVVAVTHGSGCGMRGEGEGFDILQRTLLGYATHPNVAAVLLVGLGCEVNQVSALAERVQALAHGPVQTLGIQSAGGTAEAIAQGKALLHSLLTHASAAKRSPVPASHLVVGLQCGGSDGYSGISANPVLGAAVDRLVSHGATAILSETPEIYGAEHLLTARAVNADVAQRLMQRVQWWEAYARQHGASLDNNPSPGNKAGGLTTILEKSLGAVAKAGRSGLMDVLAYAQPVQTPGLVFMDTPGYDPVSATGQVAGGANLICFTTGRGSTFGCKPTPSLKIASNTPLYERMRHDMDFNAGQVIDGVASVEACGEQLFQSLLEVASGRPTASEVLGLGDMEFVPWQLGAVM
ncbi:UxaA family hydrolase [Hydrogenophaga soli]